MKTNNPKIMGTNQMEIYMQEINNLLKVPSNFNHLQ